MSWAPAWLLAAGFVASLSGVEPVYGTGAATRTEDSSVNVEAERTAAHDGTSSASSGNGETNEQYFSATPALCELVGRFDGTATRFDYACDEGFQLAYAGIECDGDAFAQGALFRQVREDDGSWSDPEMLLNEDCVTPADLLAEAERAFASLPIEASGIVVQPPDGWTLVNLPTITYTQDDAQIVDVTLLGIPVQIRAQPEEYAWDYGDGSDLLVTSDPGAAYPDHTVFHTYEQPADTVTIGLTTYWSGQFRIVGSPSWTDVPGTAMTTSSADPLQVYEARSRLVTDHIG